MARTKKSCFGLNAGNLLDSLRVRGGSAPLHSIGFSNLVIQSLLDQKLVKVQNTGCGFLLEINEEK
ncbi:MAG: hypothetical protein KME59_18630 [Trichormus sp. ATA11-4-KO1]|jgi:hypothetical protein|nr:hypothetical protein [Trichormus sp. ATA11-4-KO1]